MNYTKPLSLHTLLFLHIFLSNKHLLGYLCLGKYRIQCMEDSGIYRNKRLWYIVTHHRSIYMIISKFHIFLRKKKNTSSVVTMSHALYHEHLHVPNFLNTYTTLLILPHYRTENTESSHAEQLKLELSILSVWVKWFRL